MLRAAAILFAMVVLGAVAFVLLGGGAEPPVPIESPGRPVDADAAVDAVGPDRVARLQDGDGSDLRSAVAEPASARGIIGRVRAAGGAPVAGAAVWLLRVDVEERLASATAGEGGEFVFPLGLPDDAGIGSFRVAAHHPAQGLALPVQVERPLPGAAAEVELVLREPGHGLGGVVVGPGGDPVGDQPVVMVWDHGPPPGVDWVTGRREAEVRTDASGRFVARGLRAGQWYVEFAPLDVPVGDVQDEVEWSVEVPSGSFGLRLALPVVRVEVVAVEAQGRVREVERIAVRGFDARDAGEVAARLARAASLEGLGIIAERRVEERERMVVYAVPGVFLVASAADGGSVAEAGLAVEPVPAVQRVELVAGDREVRTRVRLTVVHADGSLPARVLFRARRPDGSLVAPRELATVGQGWRELPADGVLAMPPGHVRVELLPDPFDAGGDWYATGSLPGIVELEVAPGGPPIDRRVPLEPAAWLDVVVEQAPGPATEAAREARAAEPAEGHVPIVRAAASIACGDTDERAVRLAWVRPDGSWLPTLGVPHLPGTRVVIRPLSVFPPGECRFAIKTWRPATREDAGGWPLTLSAGRNVLRLHLDAEGVLHR